jgi:hypothetical protein
MDQSRLPQHIFHTPSPSLSLYHHYRISHLPRNLLNAMGISLTNAPIVLLRTEEAVHDYNGSILSFGVLWSRGPMEVICKGKKADLYAQMRQCWTLKYGLA